MENETIIKKSTYFQPHRNYIDTNVSPYIGLTNIFPIGQKAVLVRTTGTLLFAIPTT